MQNLSLINGAKGDLDRMRMVVGLERAKISMCANRNEVRLEVFNQSDAPLGREDVYSLRSTDNLSPLTQDKLRARATIESQVPKHFQQFAKHERTRLAEKKRLTTQQD